MRDHRLLYTFLNHLYETNALSVPPEDLTVAVEETVARFLFIEDSHTLLVVLEATKEESNAK